MLALKARCMEEGDSMMGAEEVGGLKDGRLPVRAAFPLRSFPSKALNACMEPAQLTSKCVIGRIYTLLDPLSLALHPQDQMSVSASPVKLTCHTQIEPSNL